MDPANFRTDATGRMFMSYRRSRVEEVERLLGLLHEHGIPTWQDKKNLASEPTVEAIRDALDSPTTAGAILWMSADVASSSVILQEEAPRILARARANDAFTAKLCLADGLAFGDAAKVLKMPGSMENVSKAWNLRPIEGSPASHISLLELTRSALARRLAAVHKALPAGEPLRFSLHAHAQARPAFERGYALAIDWTPHFDHRHARPEIWSERLLPALASVAEAVRTSAPKRAVIAEGHISIATAFALGRAFMVPAGLSLAWNQLPRKELWTLGPPETEPGLVSELTSQDANATALAVLVSVRGNVEPAVVATQSTLPSFRAILRLRPQAGEHVVNITDPGQASAAARLVADEIRRARQVHQVIRTTHLFYSGPVGMAMMIGQQLNALGPVQMYEHHQTPDDAVGTYVPAALLTDPVARSYQGGKRHGTPVVLR